MRQKSLFYRFTLGLLIGALIMPAQPARAQWAVYDAAGHKTQIAKKLEDAARHAKTFDNAVKQLTTLRGVLGKAEELVTDRLISKETMKEIGLTVRTSFELKEQVQSIITTRLTMLKSIDDRLSNGILDPEADMRDLETYLRTSIGRSSQDSLANLERLRRMDNTLERLTRELRKAQAGMASTQADKKMLNKTLKAMRDAPPSMVSTESVSTIVKKISDCEALIEQYKSRISELWSKIEERVKKYHGLTDARIRFGEQVKSTNQAWRKFNQTLIDAQKSLETF